MTEEEKKIILDCLEICRGVIIDNVAKEGNSLELYDRAGLWSALDKQDAANEIYKSISKKFGIELESKEKTDYGKVYDDVLERNEKCEISMLRYQLNELRTVSIGLMSFDHKEKTETCKECKATGEIFSNISHSEDCLTGKLWELRISSDIFYKFYKSNAEVNLQE